MRLLLVSIIVFAFSLVTLIPISSDAALLRFKNDTSAENFQIGSAIYLEIIPDSEESKSKEPDTPWTVEFTTPQRWQVHGPLLIDTYSIGEARTRTQKIAISAVVLEDGQQEIPAFQIRAEGSTDLFATNSLRVSAKSNFQSDAQLKQEPPAWFVEPFTTGGLNRLTFGILLLFILGLIALGIYFVIRFLKNRKRKSKSSALTILNNEIDELSKFIQLASTKSNFEKQFSYRLISTLKNYLSAKLQIKIAEATDSEILQNLRGSMLSDPQIEICNKLLTETTLPRYFQGSNNSSQIAAERLDILRKLIGSIEAELGSKEEGVRDSK